MLSNHHSRFVLQFVADILSIDFFTDVLYELIPQSSHLVCSCLVSIVEHIGSKCGAETTLWCLPGTSVVLSSSVTTSTMPAVGTSTVPSVAASTVATASSSSTHNEGRKKGLFANAMIGLLLIYLLMLRLVFRVKMTSLLALPGGL